MAFAPLSPTQHKQRIHNKYTSTFTTNPSVQRMANKKQELRARFLTLVGKVGLPWIDALLLEQCIVTTASAATAMVKPASISSVLNNNSKQSGSKSSAGISNSLSRTPSAGTRGSSAAAAGSGLRGVRNISSASRSGGNNNSRTTSAASAAERTALNSTTMSSSTSGALVSLPHRSPVDPLDTFAPSLENLQKLVDMMETAHSICAEALQVAVQRESVLMVLRSEMRQSLKRDATLSQWQRYEEENAATTAGAASNDEDSINGSPRSTVAPSSRGKAGSPTAAGTNNAGSARSLNLKPSTPPSLPDDNDNEEEPPYQQHKIDYAAQREANMNAAVRRIVSCLKELDQKTDDVVSLILVWRTMLHRPLPFLVDGFNYLLKIRSDIDGVISRAHLFVLENSPAKGSLKALKEKYPDIFFVSHYMSVTGASDAEALRSFADVKRAQNAKQHQRFNQQGGTATPTTTSGLYTQQQQLQKSRAMIAVEAVMAEQDLQERYVSEMLLRSQQRIYPPVLSNVFVELPRDPVTGSFLSSTASMTAPAGGSHEVTANGTPLAGSGTFNDSADGRQESIDFSSTGGFSNPLSPYFLSMAKSFDANAADAPNAAFDRNHVLQLTGAAAARRSTTGLNASLNTSSAKKAKSGGQHLIYPIPLVVNVPISVFKDIDGQLNEHNPNGTQQQDPGLPPLHPAPGSRPPSGQASPMHNKSSSSSNQTASHHSKYVKVMIVDEEGMISERGLLYLFHAESKLSAAKGQRAIDFVDYSFEWMHNCYTHAKHLLADQAQFAKIAQESRGSCALLDVGDDDGFGVDVGAMEELQRAYHDRRLDKLVDIYQQSLFVNNNNEGISQPPTPPQIFEEMEENDEEVNKEIVQQLLRAAVRKLAKNAYQKLIRFYFFRFERRQRAGDLAQRNELLLAQGYFWRWSEFFEGRRMAAKMVAKLEEENVQRYRTLCYSRWRKAFLINRVHKNITRKLYASSYFKWLLPVALARSKRYAAAAATSEQQSLAITPATTYPSSPVTALEQQPPLEQKEKQPADQHDEAALALQCAMRQQAARREVALKRGQKVKGEGKLSSSNQDSSSSNPLSTSQKRKDNEDAAALALQGMSRQHLAREAVRQKREEIEKNGKPGSQKKPDGKPQLLPRAVLEEVNDNNNIDPHRHHYVGLYCLLQCTSNRILVGGLQQMFSAFGAVAEQ